MHKQFKKNKMDNILSFDPEVAEAIQEERIRQEEHLELIASENYTSAMVMEAQGSCLTNKYAEGYAGKRYYGGCEFVDKVEELAVARACELFGTKFANVQPHSGSQANQAVYMALLKAGDTILGMDLKAGGHLTHGSSVNASGKLYDAVCYGLDEDGRIDYEQVRELAITHQAKLIIAGFSAYSGVVDWAKFRQIADEVGAYLMVDMAHVAGLVAAGVYPSPVGIADVITSTTHKTLAGPRGGIILTDDEEIAKKINSAVFPALQGGPLMHVIAAKAVAFKEALTDEFKDYQRKVVENSKAMAMIFRNYEIELIGGGTENHLMLIKTMPHMTGKEFESLLGQANITVNKNSIPNDTQSPFVTSGIRIGTPAITKRGFTKGDSEVLAIIISKLLLGEMSVESAKDKVRELTKRYPLDF